MYCTECKKLVDEPNIEKDENEFYPICPECGSPLETAVQCDNCGDWVAESDLEHIHGKNLCDFCSALEKHPILTL